MGIKMTIIPKGYVESRRIETPASPLRKEKGEGPSSQPAAIF